MAWAKLAIWLLRCHPLGFRHVLKIRKTARNVNPVIAAAVTALAVKGVNGAIEVSVLSHQHRAKKL